MSRNLYLEIVEKRNILKIKYLSIEDETKLYYQEYLPSHLKKALLCFHGLGGHGGGFSELGEKLMTINTAVYAVDIRGHGLSQRENEKYFSFDKLFSDVKVIVDFFREKHSNIPLYLLGESMGGIIILNYAIEHQGIDGLILLSPGIKPNIKLSALDCLKLLAVLPISLIFKNLKLVNMEANWDKANNDPEQVRRMKEDPLLLRRMSLAFLLSIVKYHKKIMRECINLDLPTLILQGKADEVVLWEGAEEFYYKLKSKDKKIKLFENGSHGLLADENTPEAIKTIEEWLGNR